MKIAVVVPSFPEISETFILNQITGFLDEGHEVEIIAFSKNIYSKTHQAIEDYKLMAKTRFPKKLSHKKLWARIGAIFDIFRYGIQFPRSVYKALRYLLWVNHEDFYSRLNFFFLMLSCKSDIYHFHFGQVGRFGAAVKKMGIPFQMITSFHGYDVNSIPLLEKNDYYSELFEQGDIFIANTAFTKNQAVKLGCNPSRICVIPVGLHIKNFPFYERHYPSEGPVEILTVGRLVEKKGYFYSLQAVARLIKNGFNIRYTIAGDGPLRNEMENLVNKLGISGHVTFTGKTTQQAVVQLYQRAHLFVLSSATASNGDREGQGLVLQEAQACGLPVISTLHNGIPEGVLDGQAGYLVPEKDIDALTNAIQKLLERPALWPRMGRTGREFVERNYEIKKLNEKLIGIYKEIIRGGTKRSPS
jgi:colanic acid/amylovoran biosynthesis glycosyltransferase